MRVLPRIYRPTLKRWRRTARRWQRYLSVVKTLFGLELLVLVAVWLFTFTGRRAAYIDSWGRRADLLAMLVLAIGFVGLHFTLNRYVTPRIKRYFSPVAYEDRQVLFSLGQEARTASNIRELYAAIARRIATSFEADDVSILVRDEASGDYVARVSSSYPQTPGTNDGGAESNLRLVRDAFVVKRMQALSTPLVIESTEYEIWDRAIDAGAFSSRSGRAQEREVLKQLKSHLLVQVRTRDQMMGILSLGLRRGQFRYSTADREVLTSVAGQLALVIENSRLAERMIVQERLNRELALAVEVQQRLLPSRSPDNSSLELAGFCEPARGVGGDYYDFIMRDDRQLGIAIADVSGKGLPAALLMSTVQATLRSLAAK